MRACRVSKGKAVRRWREGDPTAITMCSAVGGFPILDLGVLSLLWYS